MSTLMQALRAHGRDDTLNVLVNDKKRLKHSERQAVEHVQELCMLAANKLDLLYDGYSVLQAMPPAAKARTSAENVSDVLDAVVALLRLPARPTTP